jgi:hypothetical protein
MDNKKTPWIVDNFFSKPNYEKIMNRVNTLNYNDDWVFSPDDMHRWTYESSWVDNILLTNLDKARKEFNSSTLLPTYSLLSLYSHEKSALPFHYDTNACTYSFDVCLYSKDPWPLTIDGIDYTPKANQAIAMYGEDQYHGRPPFSKGNVVLMMFLHYAEPDHWYFKYDKEFS